MNKKFFSWKNNFFKSFIFALSSFLLLILSVYFPLVVGITRRGEIYSINYFFFIPGIILLILFIIFLIKGFSKNK